MLSIHECHKGDLDFRELTPEGCVSIRTSCTSCLGWFIWTQHIYQLPVSKLSSLLGWFIWTQHIDQLPVGLLAQLVERCTGIAEVMGSNPVRA